MKGPLFKWFGSKWLSSKKLPSPEHPRLFEPFAGGAGYALRHATLDVVLAEKNEQLRDLWRWLIREATSDQIREIPLGVAEGTDVRSLGLSSGQALFLKMWQRTNNVGECWTISPWGNKPGQWTANTRARVADEVHEVKHWRVFEGDAFDCMGFGGWDEATWFLDPPYQRNYGYRLPPINYAQLAVFARTLRGQVIVCEAMCQETGLVPVWLPFEFFASRITSRRKAENNHHSKELLWTRKSVSL